MPQQLNPRNSADDGIDFQPLSVRPKPAPIRSGPAPRTPHPAAAQAPIPHDESDQFDFQPVAEPLRPAAPQATIAPYKPPLLKRLKDIFTAGVPRYSSRTAYDPK